MKAARSVDFDEDDGGYAAGGSFRVPDKDVYRRMFTTFGTVSICTVYMNTFI